MRRGPKATDTMASPLAPATISDDDDDDDDDDAEHGAGSSSKHTPLPSSMIGDNSPGKRSSKSDVWRVVKRLKQGHSCGDYTHICTAPVDGGSCNQLFKLPRSGGKSNEQDDSKKGTWISTKAMAHLTAVHPSETKAGSQGKQRAEESQSKKKSCMFEAGLLCTTCSKYNLMTSCIGRDGDSSCD